MQTNSLEGVTLIYPGTTRKHILKDQFSGEGGELDPGPLGATPSHKLEADHTAWSRISPPLLRGGLNFMEDRRAISSLQFPCDFSLVYPSGARQPTWPLFGPSMREDESELWGLRVFCLFVFNAWQDLPTSIFFYLTFQILPNSPLSKSRSSLISTPLRNLPWLPLPFVMPADLLITVAITNIDCIPPPRKPSASSHFLYSISSDPLRSRRRCYHLYLISEETEVQR